MAKKPSKSRANKARASKPAAKRRSASKPAAKRQAAPQSSAKHQFLDTYKREHATTMKVLNAFPHHQQSFKPHERSSSALQLAWTFAIENGAALAALRGPLDLGNAFPPAPPTFAEAVAAYQTSAKELMDLLPKTPDKRLGETVTFFVAPGQMGPVPVGELLWFMLMDSIHHRGQMSVYLRCAGGKVPSIYGPSADEPWR